MVAPTIYLIVGMCGIGAFFLTVSAVIVCVLSGRISEEEREHGQNN